MKDHNEGYNKEYYVRTWVNLLGEFLGWGEDQVMSWIKERGLEQYLNNPSDMIFHETPQYWVLDILIPYEYKKNASNLEIIALEKRILASFKDDNHYNFPIDTDWRPYKDRVQKILSEYGYGLP